MALWLPLVMALSRFGFLYWHGKKIVRDTYYAFDIYIYSCRNIITTVADGRSKYRSYENDTPLLVLRSQTAIFSFTLGRGKIGSGILFSNKFSEPLIDDRHHLFNTPANSWIVGPNIAVQNSRSYFFRDLI